MNPTAEESVVAWLHDVVEDTPVTVEDVDGAFGSQVSDAVDAITRRTAETDDYYARVKANSIALTVKAADNTDPLRRLIWRPTRCPQRRAGSGTLEQFVPELQELWARSFDPRLGQDHELLVVTLLQAVLQHRSVHFVQQVGLDLHD